MVDLEELAQKTVKHAMALGVSHCDVIFVESRYTSAEIEKSSMKQSSSLTDPGAGVRCFKGGSPGFACCTSHDMKRVKRVAELAASQAKAGRPDPDFKGLPGASKPRRRKGLFDPSVARIAPADLVDMAIELSDAASDDKRITSVNAGIVAGECSLALANSEGFSGSQRLSVFEASSEAVAEDASGMFSGVEGSWGRKLDRRVIGWAGKEAREHAIRGLGAVTVKTGDYPVVLDPLAAGFLLVGAVGGGANAEGVQRRRSYLTGRLGQKIGSDILTLADDPTPEWMIGSYAFDGEGSPARRHAIVDKGVLLSYLHDSYTAGKDSVESTGNSSRGGSVWSFRRPPSISTSNLLVSPGDSSTEEMIEDTREGIFLRETHDYPNLATGEFSGLMMESFRIRKGELLKGAVRQSTMGIGLTDMLSRIDLVGKETRYAYGAQVPALRISSARIAGSA